MDKVTSFGSNVASIIAGSDKGILGRLKQHNPHLVHIHCMAHRLPLDVQLEQLTKSRL